MKKIIAFVIFSALSQYTHAVNWVQLYGGNDGAAYIDHDSIQTHRFGNGNTYHSAWMGTEAYQEPIINNGYTVWRTTTHVLMDCTNQKMNADYAEHYDRQGNLIQKDHANPSIYSSVDWEVIEPYMSGNLVLNYVCSQVGRQTHSSPYFGLND